MNQAATDPSPRAKLKPSGDRAPGLGSRGLDWAAGGLAWVVLFWYASYVLARVYPLILPGAATEPIDFAVFWTAAKLALAGQALSAFDPDALRAASGLAPDKTLATFLWAYPPGFLLLLLPFGAMSFAAAWPSFTLASLAALGAAAWRPARALPGGWRLVAASPVVLIACLGIGQNSVLWTAGLIAALWALRSGHAAWAGFWIALLTMKPQLGLLIPVALIAAGRWQVIGWASGFTVLLSGAATLAFGAGYWPRLVAAFADVGDRMQGGDFALHLMVNPYGVGRALGAGHDAAGAVQLAVLAASAVAIAWVWSRRGIGFDLKCATLCAAIPLATPYTLYYDLPIDLAAAVFLARAGLGARWPGRLWLAVLWLGPVPAQYLHAYVNLIAFSAPILAATVLVCLVWAWRQDAAHRAAAG